MGQQYFGTAGVEIVADERFKVKRSLAPRNLRETRIGLKLSIREAAKLCKISHTYFHHIETGKMVAPERTLDRISEALSNCARAGGGNAYRE